MEPRLYTIVECGYSLDNTVLANYGIFCLVWLNPLVVVSKDMWAVKLCSNKVLQFLTVGAG